VAVILGYILVSENWIRIAVSRRAASGNLQSQVSRWLRRGQLAVAGLVVYSLDADRQDWIEQLHAYARVVCR